MFKIQTFNAISVKGLERFSRESYEVASDLNNPDAILLRSHKLTADDLPASIQAVARAGAGVNNVPVAELTVRGVPVFNTPGANANAVKELVVTAMLLGSRGILPGITYAQSLSGISDSQEMNKLLEKEKKQFRGIELKGKTLGVIGLGAIGCLVTDIALSLGMNVIGYDPALSIDAAWRLSNKVQRMENMQALLAKADFVSLHVPLLDVTRGLINADALALMKPNACLLNFARGGIVDDQAAIAALKAGGLRQYFTDFPTPDLIGVAGVTLMPHIGASTSESEENCAVMAADQLKDYLESGNIRNSVNFPAVYLERNAGYRLTVANDNVPKVLGSILSVLADTNINVIDMINKSRDDIAYNVLDMEELPSADVLAKIQAVEGVITVRLING